MKTFAESRTLPDIIYVRTGVRVLLLCPSEFQLYRDQHNFLIEYLRHK